MAPMIYRELFNEMPYGAALANDYLDSRCSTCFAQGATIPCHDENGCHRVVYCNEKCRDVDRPNHTNECVAFKVIGPRNINQFVRLLGRIMTRRMVDHGIVNLSENFPEHIPCRNLADLISHQKEIESNDYRSGEMKKALLEFHDVFSGTPLVNDFELVKRMYCIMWINCFSVSGPIDISSGIGSSLGLGFYLNISRFNHACLPDLHVFFDGARLIIQYPSTIIDEGAATEERLSMTRSPKKFNQLTISYGFSSGFSNDSYFPLRSQRRASLEFCYYFKCQCDLCSNELAAALEENAASIECSDCGKPYLWKEISHRQLMKCWGPSSKKKSRSCQKSCACGSHRREMSMVKNYVKSSNADKELKSLEEEWQNAIHFRIRDLNADQIIERCESVWEKARSYWHRTGNLRMTQLQERLFTAYSHKVRQDWQDYGTFDRRILQLALETGEATIEWFKKEVGLVCDTIIVALSHEMADLCAKWATQASSTSEAVEAWNRCSFWYTFAASIWRAYGKYASHFVDELVAASEKAKESVAAMSTSEAVEA